MLRRRSTRPTPASQPIAHQTRRDFLRNSGLAGLAVGAIGGTAGRVAVAQGETPAPSLGTSYHKTICQFCSVGCSLWAEVRNGVWVGQEPAFESPINQGTHCAKGAAMREIAIGERRLKYPMKKVAGEWTRISWDQAISELGDKLLGIRDEFGPDSVYWLGSAKYSNEQSYLFRKFAAFWGTNNVDHQARICHSTTVAGVANSYGYGAMTNTFNDIRNAKSILIIGGNPAEAHPVSMLHVLKGRENGGKMIVVDPRFTRTAAHADEYVRIRPGADIGFIWGLIREIFANGWEDSEFIRQRVWGVDRILEEADRWTLEEVERVSGIPGEQTARVARTIAENRPGTLIWCMGLTQSTVGSSKTRVASILQLVLGNIGKSGGGANIFRGHDNVQGATDLGVACDTLPAYYGLDQGAWRHWCRVWDVDYEYMKGRFDSVDMMQAAGMPLSRYMDAILEPDENLDQPNPVKAMIFWGHAANSITRGPEQRAALDAVDVLCVIDPHPTQVAIMTSKQDNVYLLPAATTAEMHGSVTNSSRSVQWRDKVFEPLFEAKTDYEITYRLARAFGFADEMFKHIAVQNDEPLAEDILREVNRGTWTIGYTAQSPERLKRHMAHQDKFDSITMRGMEEPVTGEYYCLPWPAWGKPEDGHPGSPILYDTSRPVAEGGLPFRARWGVEHEGENLLAEDSFPVGSAIKDGYPEGTVAMLDAMGWSNELTARERLIIISIGADRFRHEMLTMPEDEAQAAIDRMSEVELHERAGNSDNIDEAWQSGDNVETDGRANGGGSDDRLTGEQQATVDRLSDYTANALTAIRAYLADNPQNSQPDDATLRDMIQRVNWKTDLSGGIQRVMIAHGLAPYGNGKARAVVWTFPDPVPLHREPLLTTAPRSAARIRNLRGSAAMAPAGALRVHPEDRLFRRISDDPDLGSPGRIRGRR